MPPNTPETPQPVEVRVEQRPEARNDATLEQVKEFVDGRKEQLKSWIPAQLEQVSAEQVAKKITDWANRNCRYPDVKKNYYDRMVSMLAIMGAKNDSSQFQELRSLVEQRATEARTEYRLQEEKYRAEKAMLRGEFNKSGTGLRINVATPGIRNDADLSAWSTMKPLERADALDVRTRSIVTAAVEGLATGSWRETLNQDKLEGVANVKARLTVLNQVQQLMNRKIGLDLGPAVSPQDMATARRALVEAQQAYKNAAVETQQHQSVKMDRRRGEGTDTNDQLFAQWLQRNHGNFTSLAVYMRRPGGALPPPNLIAKK